MLRSMPRQSRHFSQTKTRRAKEVHKPEPRVGPAVPGAPSRRARQNLLPVPPTPPSRPSREHDCIIAVTELLRTSLTLDYLVADASKKTSTGRSLAATVAHSERSNGSLPGDSRQPNHQRLKLPKYLVQASAADH